MVEPSNSKMLNLSNLIKQYDGVRAVDDVSFTVEKGDIFGFLGPNGAGKTTTIRMIMGIIHQDSGFIELNGKDVNTLERDNFGYLPEDRGLYQKQKLEETIIYFGILRGLEKSIAKTKANEWLERFGLGDQGNRKIEELSKGNQQKIQFILSLIHDPDLLILDEPFTGLDPLNQLLLKEIIQDKRSDGKTILFSTHQMEQVERLCTNICLINKGKIIKEGTPNELTMQLGQSGLSVHLSGWEDQKSELLNDFTYTYDNGRLHFSLLDPEKDMAKIINILTENNCHIQSVSADKSSLEDVFLDLTGEKIN